MKQQYAVYYRTVGMTEKNEPGWKRTDILADSPILAARQFLENKAPTLIHYLRVYPAAEGWAWKVDHRSVLRPRHIPHDAEDLG